MKQFSIIIILLTMILSGCSKNNTEPVESSKNTEINTNVGQNKDQDDTKPDDSGTQKNPIEGEKGDKANTKDQFELSNYFKNQSSPSVENNADEFEWKNQDVSLTAKKTKAKQVGPEAHNMSSIKIKKADKSYDLKLSQNPSQIDSVSLSPNQNYLAVSFDSGSVVVLMNLNNGESVNLNSELELSGKKRIQYIHPYSWSPNSDTLALAYENPSSNIALYSTDNKQFSFTTTDTKYISTAFLLWNKNGDSLDIVSEQPSDVFKLYRLDIQNQTVKEIAPISRDELSSLKDYGPTIIDK